MSDITNDERKASEILLSVEANLVEVKKHLTIYNTSLKMILDRTNKIYTYIDKLEKEIELENQLKNTNLDPQFVAPPTSIFDKEDDIPIAEAPLEIDESPLGTRRTSRVQNTLTPETKEAQKNVPLSERKIPVVQRITDHNGKDIMLADISIMTEDQKLITKVKTNAMGKWQTTLKAGKYIVHLVKIDQSTKNKIEAKQLVTIPAIAGTHTLPVAIIKKV